MMMAGTRLVRQDWGRYLQTSLGPLSTLEQAHGYGGRGGAVPPPPRRIQVLVLYAPTAGADAGVQGTAAWPHAAVSWVRTGGLWGGETGEWRHEAEE